MKKKKGELHIIQAFGGKRVPLTVDDVKNMVPEGWELVIETLIHDLLEMGWDGQITQVKEKYGTLRFYTGPTTEKMHDRINQAEHQTEYVCAECGALADAGMGTYQGYVSVACKEHTR